jgi:hypothetical protein
MAQEAFCPEHGPYDASLGACPYPHEGAARPGAPWPLEEDLPTDPGFGGRSAAAAPTGGEQEEEGETQIPESRRRAGYAGPDDEGDTQLPQAEREDITELEEVMTPVLGLLWVKEGPRRGKYYPIKHGTVVGRKETSSLRLDDPKVSGMHAKFNLEDDGFVIWDLGSANGTYVNGRKIREATALEENDLVKIGESVFVIKLLESKPKRKTARADKSAAKKSARKPRKAA